MLYPAGQISIIITFFAASMPSTYHSFWSSWLCILAVKRNEIKVECKEWAQKT